MVSSSSREFVPLIFKTKTCNPPSLSWWVEGACSPPSSNGNFVTIRMSIKVMRIRSTVPKQNCCGVLLTFRKTPGQKVSGRTVQITVGVQVGTWPCWSSLASVSPPTSGFGLAMSRARPCSGSFIFCVYKLDNKKRNGETGHHYLILFIPKSFKGCFPILLQTIFNFA